ncbi:MAG: rod shape-determining protein MreC [Prevotellaceae bacterium]|nr:rod shape-determining protein MreC [Prevotellaceae bacterium]
MNSLLKFILRFHNFILFLILEGVALILISNSSYYQRSQMYNGIQVVQNYAYNILSEITEYLSLKETNEELARENARLLNILDHYVNVDSTRLQGYIDSRNGKLYTYIPAKVVNLTTNKQNNFITLNAGEWGNVHPDMGVISEDGIVGVVINTSARYATVMSLLNRNFMMSVRLRRTGYLGSLIWDGHDYREALIQEIPQHVPIAVGDTIETSGFSKMFPEGIFIGTVLSHETKKGNFHNIRIKLNIDFKKLRHVNVIEYIHQAEQTEMERRYE